MLRPPASLGEEPDALQRHAIVKQLNQLVVARWAAALQVCIDKVADEAKKRKLTTKNEKRVKKPKLVATAVEVSPKLATIVSHLHLHTYTCMLTILYLLYLLYLLLRTGPREGDQEDARRGAHLHQAGVHGLARTVHGRACAIRRERSRERRRQG